MNNKNHYNLIVKLSENLYPGLKVKEYLNPYYKLACKLERTRGKVNTAKLLKNMRLHCTRYICGEPLLTNKDVIIGLDRSGWPKRLHFLKPLAFGSLQERKFLMTILNLSRTLKLKTKDEKESVKPDYESITKPGGIKSIIPTGFIRKFVKDYNLKQDRPTFDIDRDVFISSKSGPEGKATLTALDSLFSYSYELMNSIFKLTDQSGIDYFTRAYNYVFEKRAIRGNLGKLALIYDPECKVRIVAILDYFTQLYLKPIHDKIMNGCLPRLSQDRTFTQDPRNNWYENGESFWSLDLSSATDRFPISLQRRLLCEVFDKELSDGWYEILSKRIFTTPQGDSVNYTVGQPMGAYSSWAAFTLTHHMVVQWCAHLCGKANFSQYIMLGDDIVIKDDKVAKMYIKWINKLGAELSINKTHVSPDTYEFAKRWFCGDEEITGVPTNGILNNHKNPFVVLVILYDYFKVKNNYYGSHKDLVAVTLSLYRVLSKKLGVKFQNSKFKGKLQTFRTALDHLFGYATYDSLRSMLANNIKNELYMLPTIQAMHQEIDGIVNIGMVGSIRNGSNSLQSLFKSIINLNTEENDSTYYHFEDANELRFYPILDGLIGYVKRYNEALEKWDLTNLNIRQVSKDLLTLNVEALFQEERNHTLEILNAAKIFSTAFKVINETDEIYYGSATVDSTWSTGQDLLRYSKFSSTYSNSFDEMLKLRQGDYKPPAPMRTAEEMMSAWANF